MKHSIKSTQTQSSRKSGLWTLRKSDPIPNFNGLVRNLFLTNLRVLISDTTISQPENTQIRYLSSRFWGYLFSKKPLQLENFEGIDFKYRVFHILTKKHPNKAFWVPNLKIFIFVWNSLFWNIEGNDFK